MKLILAGVCCLSNVGLLPALLAGCDIDAIHTGARENVAALFENDAMGHAAAQGAALQYAHMQAGRMVSVLMPYADRLDRLTFWFRQLWAESLGKAEAGRCRPMRWARLTSTVRYSSIWTGRMTNFSQ